MTLDLYDKQQVLNILLAVHCACEGTSKNALAILQAQEVKLGEGQALDEKLVHLYRQGFNDALSSVALAFGLPERDVPKLPWRAS